MKGDKMKGNEEVVFITGEHPGVEKKKSEEKGD
jgi:hypothetical protein